MDQLTEYQTYMGRQGFSERTIEQRVMFARRVLSEWTTWTTDPDRIADWLSAYRGHTKRTYYDHLRALYRWLAVTGRVEANPMDIVSRPPTPKPRPRPLARADATAVLLASSGDLRAHILLGRLAGLRAHEIAKFSGEDIDEDSLYVFGKGQQGMVLPTHSGLWTLAQAYPRRGFWFPSDRNESGHIHPHTVTMRISRHFAALGIDGSSHRNRHSYGTELLRGGANIRVVQELMRHADMTTTVRYLGVDQDDKVNAVRALVA